MKTSILENSLPAIFVTAFTRARAADGPAGFTPLEDLLDSFGATTPLMFGTGARCGWSPKAIENRRKFGSPAHRPRWYRGGLQNRSKLALTSIEAAIRPALVTGAMGL